MFTSIMLKVLPVIMIGLLLCLVFLAIKAFATSVFFGLFVSLFAAGIGAMVYQSLTEA